MDSRRRFRRADSVRRPRRRQFLATVGTIAAVGLAGCTGSGVDGESGGGDGGSGDGGPGTEGASDPRTDAGDESSDDDASNLACEDLTAGYTAYSSGGGELFSRFEIPSVLADATEVMPVESQVWVRAVRPLSPDGGAQFHLSVMQGKEGQETARGLLDVEEAVTEIEFAGETLTVSKMSQTELSAIEQLRVSLPFDDGDGTRYYPLTVQLEVENAPDGEVSEACDSAIDEAARHVIASLRPDPDTSFGESGAAALFLGHDRWSARE